MKIGLVGFAASGKSTLFSALTGLTSGSGGRSQLGTIRVPDDRLEKLAEIYRPKKVTYAEIVCVDVPGRASSAGQGLDSATLEAIRDLDALALVIGAFSGAEAAPVQQVDDFVTELILTDLLVVERRVERLQKQHDKAEERKVCELLLEHLQSEQPLSTIALDDAQQNRIKHVAFVSDKPLVVAINASESALEDGTIEPAAQALRDRGIRTFVMSAPLEAELGDLTPDEQADFLAELGLEDTAREQFIHAAYQALDWITFLTAGDKEVHAWPIRRGTNARRAAGRIHTDLERGFIRAEAFHFDDIVEAGSEAAIKAAGKFRLEGKDYIVQDGDVLLIRHSS